jgi:hypothetical protein
MATSAHPVPHARPPAISSTFSTVGREAVGGQLDADSPVRQALFEQHQQRPGAVRRRIQQEEAEPLPVWERSEERRLGDDQFALQDAVA